MPPLTVQIDPATRARVADDTARIKCPACGGSCTREERAGTGAGRRVQVQCAYCEFGELIEIHADGTACAIDPEPADRKRASALPNKKDAPRPPKPSKETAMPYDSLTINEKRRWSYVKKAVPGIDIEQWIADGKPKPTHYRQAAKARAKAPSKPVRPNVEATSTPAPVQQPAAPRPLIMSEPGKVSDPLMDLASSLIATAAKRGGRCRVMILDLTLAGDSDS